MLKTKILSNKVSLSNRVKITTNIIRLKLGKFQYFSTKIYFHLCDVNVSVAVVDTMSLYNLVTKFGVGH